MPTHGLPKATRGMEYSHTGKEGFWRRFLPDPFGVNPGVAFDSPAVRLWDD